ncbi:MAG TPA: universal stress protein [Propionibacteriaceae bacterium]|nr:universal stress protein [Propionibacteriaceae bacterium]
MTGAVIMIKNCVIVGLNDSAASRAAHQWAAAYAHATGKDLCAVHVLDWPIGLNASAVKSGTRLCVPKQEITEPYWRGMHRVFDCINSPQGSGLQFAQGDVGDVWVRFSANAELLVVGTRQPVRGRPYLTGSVSHYCISHASCPVVTIPELLPEPLPDLSGNGTRYEDTALAAAR